MLSVSREVANKEQIRSLEDERASVTSDHQMGNVNAACKCLPTACPVKQQNKIERCVGRRMGRSACSLLWFEVWRFVFGGSHIGSVCKLQLSTCETNDSPCKMIKKYC
jgi:hypothetical protein